jgi:chaperonin GroEL
MVGINEVAAAVGCTLGPRGKTVIIQQLVGRPPIVTKDGVTVSKAICPRDPLSRLGADIIRQAAIRTNEQAGDGTTTATVLAHSLAQEALILLEAGYPSVELSRGMEAALRAVDVDLENMTQHITDPESLKHVATVSANGDVELGTMIASAFERVGVDGVITVEETHGLTTSLDVIPGMRLDRGYLSSYFVTDNDRMNATYEDIYVMVCDRKLSSIHELVPILERVQASGRPLLIVANDLDGDAMQGLVLNRVKSRLPVVAIRSPGFGPHRVEMLADLCAATGATLVSPASGISVDKVTLKELGRAKRVIVDQKATVLIADTSSAPGIKARVDELRSRLEDVTASAEDIMSLRSRIAGLAGGVAVIRVGGMTELDAGERRYRVEDALNATRAAAEGGIVAGGGTALFLATHALSTLIEGEKDRSVRAGISLVAKACEAPLRRIVTNSGSSPDVVLNELKKTSHLSDEFYHVQYRGYNAAKGTYDDMMVAGIIDPARVTRAALANAVATAITFVNIDAIVVEDAR